MIEDWSLVNVYVSSLDTVPVKVVVAVTFADAKVPLIGCDGLIARATSAVNPELSARVVVKL